MFLRSKPHALVLGLILAATVLGASAEPEPLASGRGLLVPAAAEAYVPKGSQMVKNPAVAALLAKAKSSLAAGDLDGAEQAFSEAAKREPGLYAPKLGLADIALRRGKASEADRHVAAAQSLAPASAEVAAVAGRLAFSAGRKVEAQKQFEKAISLDPGFVTPLTDLGELHLAAGQSAESVKAFRQAAAVAPEHAGAQFGLARALAAQRDVAGASAALEKAAKLAPSSALPVMALGELQAKNKQFDKALATMDRALKLEPRNANVRIARANTLAASGDVAGAVTEYKRMSEEAQANPAASADLQFRMGLMLEMAKRPAEAQAAYAKAVELEPKFHLAHNNFAWLAAQRRQDLDAALKHARQALELAPGNASYEDTLGTVLAARGDNEAASQAYQRALKALPGAPAVLYRLGLVQESAGRKDEAVKSYKGALAATSAFGEREDAAKRLAALGGRP